MNVTQGVISLLFCCVFLDAHPKAKMGSKKRMKLILFGANGMLGTYLKAYFEQKTDHVVIPLTRAEWDITMETLPRLESFLERIGLDENTCIINAAGCIPQRMKGQSVERYHVVNTLFPQCLATICRQHGAHFICPTTDCVFSGKKGNYTEGDPHDETSEYGISKSLGEPLDATVIRTSIIGEEKNSKVSFLEFAKQSRGLIQGWTNHRWNGITCYQYCKIIDQILKTKSFWKGVRHIHSPHSKTKYELACIIRTVYGTTSTIVPQAAPESIDRTLCTLYDTNATFQIPPLEQQIQEQYEEVAI